MEMGGAWGGRRGVPAPAPFSPSHTPLFLALVHRTKVPAVKSRLAEREAVLAALVELEGLCRDLEK